MTQYAAFLRGVNVNGRKVGKDDLRACFEDLKFGEVKTYINSGNVTFASDESNLTKLRADIEAALTTYFGMAIITFVYPLTDIKRLIDDYPFERLDDVHAYAVLTDGALTELLQDWPGSEVDNVEASALGFYWSVPRDQTLDSPFAKFTSPKKIAEHTTVRNLNTLEKMVASL